MIQHLAAQEPTLSFSLQRTDRVKAVFYDKKGNIARVEFYPAEDPPSQRRRLSIPDFRALIDELVLEACADETTPLPMVLKYLRDSPRYDGGRSLDAIANVVKRLKSSKWKLVGGGSHGRRHSIKVVPTGQVAALRDRA